VVDGDDPVERHLEDRGLARGSPVDQHGAGPLRRNEVPDAGAELPDCYWLRIPPDPGGRSGVIRALVPVDLGAVGAKRRATSGSERSDG
jgi:hypothetical protein